MGINIARCSLMAATGLGWLTPALALGVLAGSTASAAPDAASPQLTVERVVLLMRHGVRPSTSDPAAHDNVAAQPWPHWSVPYGWLTEHGAEAVRLAGASDNNWFQEEGLLPRTGCPATGIVTLASDSDERTIATGDAWAKGLAPGCTIANEHPPQDAPDPLFAGSGKGDNFDSAAAYRSLLAELGPEGVAGLDQREMNALRAINRILCGDKREGCGFPETPSKLVEPAPGKEPKLEGSISNASGPGQTLLLEYADGKPMSEVGWGRASPADVELISSFHATKFALSSRVPYIARVSFRALRARMGASLADDGPKVTMFVGHDGTVASLGGLFGLHWKVPGFAADDPAPGGALAFEVVRDGEGHRFVRAYYRTQTLQQIRDLSHDAPVRQPISFAACGPTPVLLCPKAEFDRILAGGAEALPKS